MRIKRLVLILFAAALVTGLAVSAQALDFNDTRGHWAEVAIDRWTDNGVLNGYAGMQFRPEANIKRGELFKMVATVMNYQDMAGNPFSDLTTNDWYYDYIMKLVAAGIVNGADGRVDAEAFITREQAIAILARIFNVPVFEEGIKAFSDWDQVSYWARAEVGGMCRAGYVKGSSGTINPRGNLKRAEAVQLLDNIIYGYIFEAETYSTDLNGMTVINTAGVTLRDMAINGDLHITQGVKSGSVLLENVKVNGDIYVSGGGPNSIRLRGSTRANNVYIDVSEQNGPCRVSVSTPAEVISVRVMPGSANAIIEGTIKLVEVMQDAEATIDNATIDELIMAGEFASARINQNARIKTLSCTAARTNTYVAGTVDYTLIPESGRGVRIDTGATAVMTQIDIWADDVRITGIGNVGYVFVNDGDNVWVTVPGAIVSVSPDAGPVRTGDGPEDVIQPGETGQVGKPGLENALNVRRVEITGATTITVDFSKEPDPAKGASPRNYTLSGDAAGVTKDQRIYPDFVELDGTKATLTFTDASFGSLREGQTAIITVSGFTAKDGSPIGIASGIYKVPSDNAVLVGGSLAGVQISGIWTGGSVGDGGTQLAVTIPRRLASGANLILNKSNGGAKIAIYQVRATGAPPTTASQYETTQLNNLQISDGDKIYIQVTAPNGVTRLYYKLTVSVIAQPTFTSIETVSGSNAVRINFADLDDETHMRIASWDDTNNTTTSWIPIVKTTADGTGYVEFDLRNQVPELTGIEEQARLYVGKNENGTIVERKNLDRIGEAVSARTADLYFTTASATLAINGLNANTLYLVQVERAGVITRMVRQANSRGEITDLGSSTGVSNITIQRILLRRLETAMELGVPINAGTVTLNLAAGTISADGLVLGTELMRVGNLVLNSDLLASGSLTNKGLSDIAGLQPGTYSLYADRYISVPSLQRLSIIPTKLDEITVTSALSEVTARFIDGNKILFSNSANALNTASRLIITQEQLDSDTLPILGGSVIDTQRQISAAPVSGKAELLTSSVTASYNDTPLPVGVDSISRRAYLATEKSISRPITVNKWLFTQYQFTPGDYTMRTATTYSNTNSIRLDVSTIAGISVIQVNGEYYEVPKREVGGNENTTLRALIDGLQNNDTITFTTGNIITGIKYGGTAPLPIELNKTDISATSLSVSGGQTGSPLTLTLAGDESYDRLTILGGTVDISGVEISGGVISGGSFLRVTVPSTVRNADIIVNDSTAFEVSGQNITITPARGGVATKEIITLGAGSVRLLGVTLSGNYASFKSGPVSTETQITVGGSRNPVIAVTADAPSNLRIKLDSAAAEAGITTAKPIVVDMRDVIGGSAPRVTLTGGSNSFTALLPSGTNRVGAIYNINTGDWLEDITTPPAKYITGEQRLVVEPSGGASGSTYSFNYSAVSGFTVQNFNATSSEVQISASAGTMTITFGSK